MMLEMLFLLKHNLLKYNYVNFDAAHWKRAGTKMTNFVSGKNSPTIAITDDSAPTKSALETI
ncbi:MAG: hypothetical protein CM15mP109_11110 [Candidatus Dadabacteria bacterium]|nr:MAG: hypothetical protein CM15mP109_11110 [Candidatus Dadabacteria bacterium]